MPRSLTSIGAAGVLLTAILAGCGQGSDSADPASDATSDTGGEPSAISGTVVVLAAASLTESFTELGAIFEAAHPGSTVSFSFAASSELATQVEQGAPADVFASASPATMALVVGKGDTAAAPITIARNSLEIVVPAGNPADVTGLNDFARTSLTIALCAPEVPCGAATDQAFSAAGVTPAPDTLEADVKATLSKVTLGEVDAALVYRTDVLAAGDKVEGIEFPEATEAVNDYPIAVLRDAPNAVAAEAFVDLVLSAEGSRTLSKAGFDVP